MILPPKIYSFHHIKLEEKPYQERIKNIPLTIKVNLL